MHISTFVCGWIVLISLLDPVAVHADPSATTAGSCTTTTLHSKLELLSRKRRYIFWAPGSAVLATMSFAKALASQYPRGVNIVAEADFFYPLPTKITDWYPTTKKPPVAVKSPKIDADINDIQYVPLAEPVQHSSLRPNDYWHQSPIHMQTPSITRLRPSAAYGALPPPLATRRQQQKQQPRPVPWRRQPSSVASDRFYRRPPVAVAREHPVSYTDWRQHRGYRERRDLYTKFETMAAEHGLDIRSCLLRMICEAKHYLLPRGKSFFHDVLRILFSVPVQHSAADVYADAMRSTLDNCSAEYRRECRFSILGLLLCQDRHSMS